MQRLKLPELPRIDRDPTYAAAVAELTALEQRLAQTERRRQTAKARLRGAKPPGTPLQRAKQLLAGGQIGAVDPLDDLKAADEEEFQILRPALIEAHARLDEVHCNLSLAACEKLRPHYTVALRAALQAMTDLAAALDAASAVRAQLRAAGYTPLETILPSGLPQAASGDLEKNDDRVRAALMEIDEMRTEVEAALRDALAARPGLFAAVEAATRAAHDAQHRWENFQQRVNRATRHGQDLLTAAVRQLLDDARAEKDRAQAALSLAKRHLGNLEWRIELGRAEVAQLELLERPPPAEGRRLETVKRPKPPGFDVISDNIVFPPGKPPDGAA